MSTVAVEQKVEAKPEPEQKHKDPHGLPDKYALIKMHPKRDDNETEDVQACVNGKNILLQRGRWAPVNWAFVECLRHAAHPRFNTEPGQQRVEIGVTERFPFQGPYEVTKKQYSDFLGILKSGSIITEQDIGKIAGISV